MQFLHYLPLMLCVTLVWLAGCASQYDYKRLPTAEQELYRAYSQVMTNKQSRTYLGLSSAERAVYAKEIGVAQQLEALLSEEREAVLYGPAGAFKQEPTVLSNSLSNNHLSEGK